MRVDLSNSSASQISSQSSSQQVSANNSSTSGLAGGEDRATLTSDSTSVGSLVSTALQFPEVRQDKVESLKQSISSGQYQLDPAKIAASIVGEQA